MEDIWYKFHQVVRLNSLALELNQVTSNAPHRQIVDIQWIPPPDGWFKMNSDGSVIDNSKATCGGLVRDPTGRFLGGFVANLGSCPVTVAELWGVYYVLQFAWNSGFNRILVEIDSLSALQLIHNSPNRSHPYAAAIRLVKEYLDKPWEVHLSHVSREANKVADGLASHGHKLDLGVTFFLYCAFLCV